MRVRIPAFAAALVLIGALTPAARAADEQAEKLLGEVKAATAAIQTLTATIETKRSFRGQETVTTTAIKLKRPNLMLVETSAGTVTSSDGKSLINLLSNKQFLKSEVDAAGTRLAAPAPLHGFFHHDRLVGPAYLAKHAGAQRVGDHEYQVLEIVRNPDAPKTAAIPITPVTTRLYIGADRLIHRVVSEIDLKENGISKSESTLRELKVNAPLDVEVFAYKLPADAKAYQPPAPRDYAANLLPVGQPAPDFLLPTPEGTDLKLSGALKGKKAVLINFWFTN